MYSWPRRKQERAGNSGHLPPCLSTAVKRTLKRRIKCKDTLWLLNKIIGLNKYEDDLAGQLGTQRTLFSTRKKGIPIGNLTSQIFSNLYLNGFDHYVKETIGAKHYIRYCDDFVLLNNSKEFLAETKETLSNYLQTIKLTLHENKSRVYQTSDGVDFLGFRIFPHYMKVRKRVVKGYRKKLKEMAIGYRNGQIDANKITRSIHSWIGHVKYANSYDLRKELISHAVFRRQ